MKDIFDKKKLKKLKIIKFYLFIKSKFSKKIEELKMSLRKNFKIQYIPDIYNNINIEVSSLCNLGCKFCGYIKRNEKEYPFKIMSDEDFSQNVKYALDFGYQNIGLSPVSGDIFMDKRISNKFKILENSEIKGYYFFTNFIATNENHIEELFKYNKLKFIGISIYGHDESSHIKIAQSNKVSYLRLISNLECLYKLLLEKNLNFEISIDQRDRAEFEIENDRSELSLIIKKILNLNLEKIKYEFETNYNNWGGMIKEHDIKELGIKLNDEKKFKVGACSLLFSRLIIGADNTVNACACRDANYSLRIGNTKENHLREIISIKNMKYKKIIENHENQNYPDVCKSCDFYTSIYSKKHNVGYGSNIGSQINLKKFYKFLN